MLLYLGAFHYGTKNIFNIGVVVKIHLQYFGDQMFFLIIRKISLVYTNNGTYAIYQNII